MNRKKLIGVVLGGSIFVALFLVAFQGRDVVTIKREPGHTYRETGPLAEAFLQLPLTFEAEETSKEMKFRARGDGYTLFLTRKAEAVLTLGKSKSNTRPPALRGTLAITKETKERKPQEVLRLKLLGSNVTPLAQGLEPLDATANYFVGNDPTKWRTNVPLYQKVKMQEVYQGIDATYYGNQRQLEQDFIVAPGADLRAIRVSVEGAQRLSLDTQGNVLVATKKGEILLQRPVAYQELNGKRQEIDSSFVLNSKNEISFKVPAYDKTRSLVIDPVLTYSTYMGGNYNDAGIGIAADSGGNAYIFGEAQSTNFPTSAGSFQPAPGGSEGTFVMKLNASGALVYSTYLAGQGTDFAYGIVVDAAGNAYVTGDTDSPNFPTTAGAFQTTRPGSTSGFATKLNPSGSALVYSTYLGGSTFDHGFAIAVDSNGGAYVTGLAESTDFPTTTGAFQTSAVSGTAHAFVTKLNSSGTALTYSTYLGGSGQDQGNGIRVDSQGSAYVVGSTRSGDFPVTAGSYQPFQRGGTNAFVTKLNSTGSALVYSTYFGGGNEELGSAIAIDSSGNAYIAGTSDSNDMPTTAGAFQATPPGDFDAFVAKLNASGSALVYSTFLGGTGPDEARAIAVDSSGNAFVAGDTSSTDFPVANALQATAGGSIDGFLTVLNPAGAALVYSSYVGGSGAEFAYGVAVDSSSNLYATGSTASADFPTTPGAFQTSNQGFDDGFVTKISAITCTSSGKGDVQGDGDEKDGRGHRTHFHICRSKHEVEFEDHDDGRRMKGNLSTAVILGNQAILGGKGTLSDGTPVGFVAVAVGNARTTSGNRFSILWATPTGISFQSGGPLTAGTVVVRSDQ